jgi:hypothetical protein
MTVFLQIRSLVWWHTVEKVLDELVRDQRVPKIELGNIWL